MENKTDSDASKYIYNPLGMGIASIVSCALFMWGTYSRITFLMFFIFCALIFSIIGLAFSFITSHVIKGHVLVWIAGLLSSLLGLFGFIALMLVQMLSIAQ